MKLEIELPEELVAALDRQVSLTAKDRSGVIIHMVEQLLRSAELDEQAQIERRPDWQAAIAAGHADILAGRVRSHEDILAWHEANSE
ncbi:MAG: hypothetical protein NTZ56_04860 [Acidobacteria bacterium]|nr:hypothetical protein [Acidobacteriota bacterium]